MGYDIRRQTYTVRLGVTGVVLLGLHRWVPVPRPQRTQLREPKCPNLLGKWFHDPHLHWNLQLHSWTCLLQSSR